MNASNWTGEMKSYFLMITTIGMNEDVLNSFCGCIFLAVLFLNTAWRCG